MTGGKTAEGPGTPASPVRIIALAVVVLAGVWWAGSALGPENPNAKSCADTEYEFAEDARLDPRYSTRELRHLAWDFPSCQKGCDKERVANACSTVATIYAEGKGLRYEGDIDLGRAAEYAAKACEYRGSTTCEGQGRYLCLADRPACEARCRAGTGADCVFLAKGIDVPGGAAYDPGRAIEFHGLACQAGVMPSCATERLVRCASDPVDCSARCKEGDAAHCFQLGALYQRGQGDVPQDPTKGLAFQRKGCELDPTVDEQCTKLLNDAQIDL